MKLPSFEGIMFDLAQLHILLKCSSRYKVVIGPKASKPLLLDIPIMIGGMVYGMALSEKAKIALARRISGRYRDK